VRFVSAKRGSPTRREQERACGMRYGCQGSRGKKKKKKRKRIEGEPLRREGNALEFGGPLKRPQTPFDERERRGSAGVHGERKGSSKEPK